MDKFDELLKNFDLEFFGSGKHKISVEKALELNRENKAIVVDLRTKEEISHVRFDFAINIPVSNMPDRFAEIPKDKIVVVFCSSVVRAAIVYIYLRFKGYNNVRILVAELSEIAGYLKPGYILKIMKKK